MTCQSIWRQQFPLMTLSSFCFSTAKYFCPLFATNAYDKKLNYCSSFQYVFLRESLQKNKRLKVDVGALGLYTALLYYSLQCIFNARKKNKMYVNFQGAAGSDRRLWWILRLGMSTSQYNKRAFLFQVWGLLST